MLQEATAIEEVVETNELDQELESLVSQFDGEITVADLVVELFFPDEDFAGIPASYSALSLEAQTFLVEYVLKIVLRQTNYSAGLVLDGMTSQFLQDEVGSLSILKMGIRRKLRRNIRSWAVNYEQQKIHCW